MRQVLAGLVALVFLVAGCWLAFAAVLWLALYPLRVLAHLIGA